jgi:hypothetical protein
MPDTNLTARGPFLISGSFSTAQTNREIYAEMAKLLDASPNWDRIARNSTVDGNGDVSPAAEQAWAVWRAVSASLSFDVIIKWSWGQFYTGGQLEIGTSNYGVGLGVAFHSSSQAWSGSTGDDGSDTFVSSNPWKSGSLIFPRQNEGGGAHNPTDREYVAAFSIDPPSATTRIVGVSTDDWVMWHLSSSQSDDRFFYFGPYVPLTSSHTFPYIMLAQESNNFLGVEQGYGSTAELNTRNGGITYITGVARMPNEFIPKIAYPRTRFSTEVQVAFSASGAEPFNEIPLLLASAEDESPVGTLGYLDPIRAVNSNIKNYDTIVSGARLVLSGFGMQSAAQITIPWTASAAIQDFGSEVPTLYTNTRAFLTSSLFPDC